MAGLQTLDDVGGKMINYFEEEFQTKQREAYETNLAHGFHEEGKDTNPLFVPTALALIMSEASEALEADRKGHAEELPAELADVVIRCMDLAEALGINLGGAIVEKMKFNSTRPFKHGNKKY